jgi:hypothetical protein
MHYVARTLPRLGACATISAGTAQNGVSAVRLGALCDVADGGRDKSAKTPPHNFG